ncbi:spore coat associated protein CotJA [Clostridium mobile]|nr:spore coat associated protein CotJA [Clostridium mobile]
MQYSNNQWMNPMKDCKHMDDKYTLPGNIQFARAYVPIQPYTGTFPLDEALRKGTLFPNLYIPYPIKSLE